MNIIHVTRKNRPHAACRGQGQKPIKIEQHILNDSLLVADEKESNHFSLIGSGEVAYPVS
jgi:hypothetical protein